MNKWKGPKSAYVKRALSATLALGLVAGTISVSTILTNAVAELDLSKACAIRANASTSTDEEFVADLETAKVVIDIYKVADAQMYQSMDGYEFEMCDVYSSLTIPTDVDSKTFSKLAESAATIVKDALTDGNPIAPEATIDAGNQVSDLGAGLYLLIARGSDVNDYFKEVEVETVDAEGNVDTAKQLVSIAYSENYEYTFAPEFVALPTKTPDPLTGEIKQSNEGEWLYQTAVAMKPAREPRYGQLKIIKDLLTFETTEPAYFVFDVEATVGEGEDAKVVYSNVFTLMFTAAKEDYIIVDKLPAGANVTVTEVYSGATYVAKSATYQETTIVANDIVEVAFTNDYDNKKKHGVAITNHFDSETDENGNVTWNWSQITDSKQEVND